MKKSGLFQNAPLADRWGIILSSLCLFHCLLLPPFLAILPLLIMAPLPEWLRYTEFLHAALLIPVVVISGPTLFRGGSVDRRIWLCGGSGILLLFLALLAQTERMEQVITVIGAVLLVVAHMLNIKARAA